jgi:hypothetical protein
MNEYFKQVLSRKHILFLYLTTWTGYLILYSNTVFCLSYPTTVRAHNVLLSRNVNTITFRRNVLIDRETQAHAVATTVGRTVWPL